MRSSKLWLIYSPFKHTGKMKGAFMVANYFIPKSCCAVFRYSMKKMDPDHLVALVTEVIPNYSCLVFVPLEELWQ